MSERKRMGAAGIVWSICGVGLLGGLLYYTALRAEPSAHIMQVARADALDALQVPRFEIQLECGALPPGEDSKLAELFDFAEENQGAQASVAIAFQRNDCSCETARNDGPITRIALACEHNPHWWLAERMKKYRCVEAIGLAGYTAGIASLCFPAHEEFTAQAGYTHELGATLEHVSGTFAVNWEWSLGAPQVQLLLAE